MALSHLCSNCGYELCGIRPNRDERFLRPVIVCPACDRAVVRHPLGPPAQRRSRQIRRAIVQFVFEFTLLAWTVACVSLTGAILSETSHEFGASPLATFVAWITGDPALDFARGRMVFYALLGFAGGAIGAGSVRHHSRAAAIAVVVAALALVYVIVIYVTTVEHVMAETNRSTAVHVRNLKRFGQSLVFSLPVVLLGFGLVTWVLQRSDETRGKLWCRVLAHKRRKRRQARES